MLLVLNETVPWLAFIRQNPYSDLGVRLIKVMHIQNSEEISLINDFNSVHKCKQTGGGHFGGFIGIRQNPYSNLRVFLFGLWLQIPVNSYDHVQTVSLPNHVLFLGQLRLGG